VLSGTKFSPQVQVVTPGTAALRERRAQKPVTFGWRPQLRQAETPPGVMPSWSAASAPVAVSFWKRALDILLAGAALLLALPLFLVIAAAIKLTSKGPVFFRQERVGYRGRIFWIWKFRTMVVDADRRKRDMMPLLDGRDRRIFKIARDPRVTSIGSWLRRTSLDELPQLLNVLSGEMSLVGPRPLFEHELPSWDRWHFERLEARPGITGLWQVSGRSRITDFNDVVALDVAYIRNWSVVSDLRILGATVPAVLRGDGAC
jgi:lipopolysaccharide/colanic/teichoic acid biosynthesis glycosyltransferase